MAERKMLPVGMEFFDELVRQNFYYVDKTGMLVELLRSWGKVNLFTRPRRFGKSLNMSMLKAFFEIGCDKSVFEGLRISEEKELCEQYMGKFPVISISLKGVDGLTFQTAYSALKGIIGLEAMRFQFLEDSERLSENDKTIYKGLIRLENGYPAMTDETLLMSLKTLSELLAKHYGKEVILLIDEYDVPLDKAFQYGYYEEMTALVRGIFGNALKTNPYLFFAVMTGCLRISKESIFTRLNNLKVLTVTDVRFDEYFGFTDAEVKEMLEYYSLSDRYSLIKEWYDGYRFGNTEVYCPWDVICYIDKLLADPDALPEDFWVNTSGNNLVRRFIDMADQKLRDEIERLLAGETIEKAIRQELTYRELDDSIENLWSVLFTTGYLTAVERLSAKEYRLAIPNMEIRDLFNSQVKEWFREKIAEKPGKLDEFCGAVLAGDADKVQTLLTDYLKQTISIRDTYVRKDRKENFYHGILLGLLSYPASWSVKSNQEAGDGYSDIVIKDMESDTGIVIEVKYAERSQLDTVCRAALKQIESQNYAEELYDDGMEKILKYGIACYKKRCKVVIGE